MKRFVFAFSVCVLVLGGLLSLIPPAQAQDGYYTLPTGIEYNSGMVGGCPVHNGPDFGPFTVPANSEAVAVVYDVTTISTNMDPVPVWRGDQGHYLFSTYSYGNGIVPGSYRMCVGSPTACTNWAAMGDSIDHIRSAPRRPETSQAGDQFVLAPGVKIDCTRQAQSIYSNVDVLYYGIEPAVANFDYEPETGNAPLGVQFTDTSTGPVSTWNWYLDDEPISTQQHPAWLFTQPGSFTVKLVVNEGLEDEDEHSEVIHVTDPEPLVRPFSAADEGVLLSEGYSPLSLIEAHSFFDAHSFNNSGKSAIGFSAGNAPVHAAATGTVTSIRPLTSDRCNPTDNECYAVFDTIDLFAQVGELPEYTHPFIAISFNLSNVYIVTVEVEANVHFRYVVTNPYDFVEVGETINIGCPLGESVGLSLRFYGVLQGTIFEWLTVQALNLFGFNLDAQGLDIPANTEFTIVQRITKVGGTDFVVPVVASMTEYPEDEPRSCDYQPSACINPDPELKRPERWTTGGSPEFWSDGGVVLNPGDWIEVQLSLDAQTNYTAEIWGRLLNSGQQGQIAIQIGQTYLTVNATSTNFQQLIVPSGTHEADVGLFYTFSIRNTGTAPVFIKSACLRDENEGGSSPNTCYFANYSFEGLPAAQGWTTTGSVNDGLIPGEIIMYHEDTIAQNAILFPDGVSTHWYIVRVTATVGGADLETLRADTTSSVDFQWEYPTGNGFESFLAPNSSTTYPVAGFFTATENGITFLPNYEIAFFAEIPVDTFTNSDFTIEAFINSANPNLHLRVREVCIIDTFEHHDEPDAWIPPAPIQANCFTVSPPSGEGTAAWIFYHWSQLDRFFQCDLMVLLNRMHDVAQKAYLLLGWQFRYWQSTAIMTANWLTTDVILWLNGHFANMALGQVTTIENSPEASLWDVLLALINVVLGPITEMVNEVLTVVLGIVHQAVNMLFTAVEGLIVFVLALLTQALNLLVLGQLLIHTILTAFNTAEPIMLPGMVSCSADPQGSAWCIAMWMLENTIFSGTGAATVPIITGILSIHLILWLVGEIKATIVSLGQTT